VAISEMANPVLERIQRVMRAFMPQEEDFFVLFGEAADYARQAADCLHSLMGNYKRLDVAVEDIANIEHAADRVVHSVLHRLNSTFVTPVLFDREDLYRIAERMDDIPDLVKGAIDRMQTYQIEKPTKECVRQADMLQRAVGVLSDTMHRLHTLRPGSGEYCAHINTIENEADLLLKKTLGDLFNSGEGAKYVLKWKDIYEVLEQAIDTCEVVANLVEAVIIKNA